MPLTLNGFGTAYRGKSDEDAEGIYVTTLFIVALYLPIFPLASYLVRPYGAPIDARPFIYDQSFDAVQIPMNWKQVLSVYVKWYTSVAIVIFTLVYLVGIYLDWRYPEIRWKRPPLSIFHSEVSTRAPTMVSMIVQQIVLQGHADKTVSVANSNFYAPNSGVLSERLSVRFSHAGSQSA
jgi:hypothetical protein